MEKAYTKISLDEILKELKNDINKYNQLLNTWSKIDHLTKKECCISHDHIAYYSGAGGAGGAGGVEIHGIKGDYIVVRGYKVPLNEFIRFGTMWGKKRVVLIRW